MAFGSRSDLCTTTFAIRHIIRLASDALRRSGYKYRAIEVVCIDGWPGNNTESVLNILRSDNH